MLSEAGYLVPSFQSASARGGGPGQRHRAVSICGRSTSPCIWARGTVDVGITGHDLLLDSSTEAGRSTWASASVRPRSLRRAEQFRLAYAAGHRGRAWARWLRQLVHDYLVAHGIGAEDHPPRRRRRVPRCSWAWPTSSPTWCPPAPRCATPGLRIFANHHALRSGAHPLPRLDPEDGRRHPQPPTAGADRAALRADGL